MNWDKITIDGVPVGDGYGVEVYREDLDPAATELAILRDPTTVVGWEHIRGWLTKRGDDGEYRRFRELSAGNIVTMRHGSNRYIVTLH